MGRARRQTLSPVRTDGRDERGFMPSPGDGATPLQHATAVRHLDLLKKYPERYARLEVYPSGDRFRFVLVPREGERRETA